MDILPILTSIIVGYFMGNLMASYLVAKWVMGYDIREHGTGNAGGSNSFMLMGWSNGLIVGIIDNLKAFLAVYIIRLMYASDYPDSLPLLMMIAGSMAVIGHIFPFFMGFRGGKGVACFMGMCLGIDGMIGLYVILIIMGLTILTDYVALASIIGYVAFPIFVAFWPEIFFNNPDQTYNLVIVSLALMVSIIGIWKHRNNISNMIKRNETGLRSVLMKHSK
tara:strand:- start:2969 stop:3631 length:663 start_codon:yes stop_codon:yes gene_type:complete